MAFAYVLNRVDSDGALILTGPYLGLLYSSIALIASYFVWNSSLALISASACYVGAALYAGRGRVLVRHAHNIPGSLMEDIAVAFSCPFCTISQMVRQVYDFRGLCGGDGAIHGAENAARIV